MQGVLTTDPPQAAGLSGAVPATPANPWSAGDETRQIISLLLRIAIIDFVVEAIIMMIFAQWQIDTDVLLQGLTDATLLTVTASPFIYLWVVAPFARAVRESNAALAAELKSREKQTVKLESTLAEVRGLLKQNEELSRSLQELAKSNEVVKEQILQRTGADLHDGPAQLLAFAMLRMSRLAKIAADTKDEKAVADVRQVQTAVSDALREVRNTSAMLSLPSLERVDLAEIVRIVVTRHQEHTDSKVQVSLESVPEHVPQSLKICIYRFVQEALSNAFRHGKGVGQHVAVRGGERLEVIVSDEGEGFDPDKLNGIGLGVSGMRARVRALGGALDVKSEPGSGTVLAAIFGKEALAGEEQTVGAAA